MYRHLKEKWNYPLWEIWPGIWLPRPWENRAPRPPRVPPVIGICLAQSRTECNYLPLVPRVRSPRPRRSWSCSPRFSPFVPSTRSDHTLLEPNLLSNIFSFCSTMFPIFSAIVWASCWGGVSWMRWNTITPDDWSKEACNSSFQIIFETIDVTTLNDRENVRDNKESESVLYWEAQANK